VNVEAAMFANRAAIEGSMLTVKGGGWEHFDVQLFPATVRGFVAGVLTIDAEQHGQLLPVVLELYDEEGHLERTRASLVAIGTRPATVPGVPYRMPFSLPFVSVVRAPTVVKARLHAQEGELAVISFAVRGGTPDAPPPDLLT
jgi:hypothetical protein